MTKEERTEQWESGGDCEKCRRKNYCSKPCKAAKERESKMLSELFVKTMIDALKRKK